MRDGWRFESWGRVLAKDAARREARARCDGHLAQAVRRHVLTPGDAQFHGCEEGQSAAPSCVQVLPRGTLPAALDGCSFVRCEPALRFLSNNRAKHSMAAGAEGDAEVWTALSTASFGQEHKAPQEFLEGTDKEKEVTRLLLDAVGRAAGCAAERFDRKVPPPPPRTPPTVLRRCARSLGVA